MFIILGNANASKRLISSYVDLLLLILSAPTTSFQRRLTTLGEARAKNMFMGVISIRGFITSWPLSKLTGCEDDFAGLV